MLMLLEIAMIYNLQIVKEDMVQKDMSERAVLVLSMLPSLVSADVESTPVSGLRRREARLAASICFLVWRCMSLE